MVLNVAERDLIDVQTLPADTIITVRHPDSGEPLELRLHGVAVDHVRIALAEARS